jgi:hypothetical protein
MIEARSKTCGSFFRDTRSLDALGGHDFEAEARLTRYLPRPKISISALRRIVDSRLIEAPAMEPI